MSRLYRMMDLPFEQIAEHKVFPSTFLQRTILMIAFTLSEGDEYEFFKDFFKVMFGLDITRERVNMLKDKPVQVINESKGKLWDVGPDFIMLTIEHGEYTCYRESLMPIVEELESYLSDHKAQIGAVSLQKINLAPIPNWDKESVLSRKGILYSDEMIKECQVTVLEDSKDGVIYHKNFDAGNCISLDITSGCILETGEDAVSRFVLDLRGSSKTVTNLSAVANSINDLLYGAFMWSVSEQVKNLLEGNYE